MARLNPSDPPPAVTALTSCTTTTTAPSSPNALDVLKRRFTRQNRDLARTNSAQSLRIRNLETEISKLLGDNLRLREEVIREREETERWRRQSEDGAGGMGMGKELMRLKTELCKRLGEVGILVEELGDLGQKAVKQKDGESRGREQRRKSQKASEAAALSSPEQKDWRNRQTITGVLGGRSDSEQEGRLPPIVEGKLYPRRTLDLLELQCLADESKDDGETESPDIGPPPVAHFDAAGRGSWGDVQQMSDEKEAELREDVVQLPSNLETRRKRRTSSFLTDMTAPASESERDAQESRPALFKSGAKRKLDLAELEESLQVSVEENDDFVFQRRPALKPASSRASGRFARPIGQQIGEIVIPATAPLSPQKEHGIKERKVLAPISINSPSKRHPDSDTIEFKPDPKVDKPRATAVRNVSSAQSSKPRREQRSDSHHEGKPRPTSSELATQADHLPPKTPAALDGILSPISTEPSIKHIPSTRAPQEAAIINSVEDVLNGSIGRGSRRVRAAVSYAEPSLREKMRRPGKGLVGAVEGIDRKARENSMGPEGFSRSQSENVLVEAGQSVKRENSNGDPGDSATWARLTTGEVRVKKEDPTSPLSDKKQASDIAGTTGISRHARKSILDSASFQGLEQDARRLSIFDQPSISPATTTEEHGKAPITLEQKAQIPLHGAAGGLTRKKSASATNSASSTSRRHSIAPSSQQPSHSRSTSISSTSILGSKSTNAPAQQRSNSAASSRSDSLDGKRNAILELKRATSSAALKQRVASGEGDENGANGTDGAARARADRIASRRRSMML